MRLIRRIDQPAPGLWSVTLHDPCLAIVIACVQGSSPVLGLLASRPEGEHRAADAQTRLLRERLEGGELLSLRSGPAAVELWVKVNEHARLLRADRHGVQVIDGAGDEGLPEVSTDPPVSPHHPEPAVLRAHRTMLLGRERAEATRSLRTAARKLRRRIDAIDSDAVRAALLEREALRAQALVPAAARAPRGATSIEAIDWSSGAAETITMQLDPARSARDHLEAVFARARRMKRGEPTRRKRTDEAAACLSQVQQALDAIAAASSIEVVRSSLGRALEVLPAGVRPRAPDQPGAARAPDARERRRRQQLNRWARQYEASDGTRLLVGRDAHGNDMLTTRVARPHDVWMHVRGQTGSHVIIVLDRGSVPSSEALIDAATLAAHFSEARGGDRVELSWCERRYVRKPKGSPPGQVAISREKNVVLRFEPERLQRLLTTVR